MSDPLGGENANGDVAPSASYLEIEVYVRASNKVGSKIAVIVIGRSRRAHDLPTSLARQREPVLEYGLERYPL